MILGCRLELENQRLQRELEAAKTQCLKTEKNSAYELEVETRRVTLEVSRLEEQGRRDQVRTDALKAGVKQFLETWLVFRRGWCQWRGRQWRQGEAKMSWRLWSRP